MARPGRAYDEEAAGPCPDHSLSVRRKATGGRNAEWVREGEAERSVSLSAVASGLLVQERRQQEYAMAM
jgi:hypothetical protein